MRGALRIGLWGSRPRTWKREREKGKEREREGDGEIVEEKKLCKQKLFSLILKRKKLLFCFIRLKLIKWWQFIINYPIIGKLYLVELHIIGKMI